MLLAAIHFASNLFGVVLWIAGCRPNAHLMKLMRLNRITTFNPTKCVTIAWFKSPTLLNRISYSLSNRFIWMFLIALLPIFADAIRLVDKCQQQIKVTA